MRINPINNNQTNFGAVYKVQANHNMIKHFDANVAQTAKNKGKSVVAFVQKAAFKYKDAFFNPVKGMPESERVDTLYVMTGKDAKSFEALRNRMGHNTVTTSDGYVFASTTFPSNYNVKQYKETFLKNKEIKVLDNFSELEKKLGYK